MNETGEFQDLVLTCVECGRTFTWTVGEQAYFREKGLMITRKRCQACRQARKTRRGDVVQKEKK